MNEISLADAAYAAGGNAVEQFVDQCSYLRQQDGGRYSGGTLTTSYSSTSTIAGGAEIGVSGPLSLAVDGSAKAGGTTETTVTSSYSAVCPAPSEAADDNDESKKSR